MVQSITEYVSFFEAGEDMTDEEYGIYMRCIHNFAFNDIEPDYSKLPPLVKAALRTVIASVRKNKDDRENGHTGGRPRKATPENEKGGIENKKPGFSENEKGGYLKTETNEKEKENENENVKENENTHNSVCAYSFAQNDIKPLKTTPSEAQSVIKQTFETIQEHNATHGNMHKMPISKTFESFVQKEGRQICELFRDFNANDVLQALNNYLRVANIDTWKSTFSFSAFCKNCIEYTPEYFSIDKYEKTDFSKDADNKPVQRFKERMSQDSRFDIATFLQHSQDWLEKGRPEGEAYFALQEEWYRQEDAKAVNYDS